MQRIFVPPDQFDGDSAAVYGTDHLHLARVLRIKAGDNAVLLDNLGAAYLATVLAVEKTCTRFRLDEPMQLIAEPAVSVLIAQALGKADKFEQVVQHGTEAGAAGFLPVRAERCAVDIRKEADRAADRLARWNQISKSAAEQSGRCRIPPVYAPVRTGELFDEGFATGHFTETELRPVLLLLHPDVASRPLRSALNDLTEKPGGFIVAVGPEGGWSPKEVLAARAAGWLEISLGRYTLRTETAALFAISQIMYYLEL